MPWLSDFDSTNFVTRICVARNIEKDINDFRQRSAPNQHLRYKICRECENDNNKEWRNQTDRDRKKVLWQYGLTLKQYDELLELQDGVCRICKQPPEEGKNLHVDHDHRCCPVRPTCGRCTRGLLCDLCNKGLGMFRDNPELLFTAAYYVKGFGG